MCGQAGFKTCSKCKTIRPTCFAYFYRQKATSDGYTSWCRDCDRKRSREDKRIARAMGKIKKPSAEKSREYDKRCRERNLDRSRKQERIQARERRKDNGYRLMSNMGRRVREMISGKAGSTRHLPYDAGVLITHLERQFTAGMNWENYGSYWHIDHIVPVSSFKTNDPCSEDFIACWSLSNLRPLPASENLSKNDRRTHLI